MDFTIDSFLNSKYRLLQIIADNQVNINGKKYCPLSQEKMALELGVTRVTVGNSINKLKDEGFIISAGFTDYELTEKAKNLLKEINKIKENELNESKKI